VSLRARLTGRLLRLAGIELKTSRFTGDEAFFVGRREVAHFHGEDTIDVRLTRQRIRSLREDLESDARVTTRGGSDWLEFTFARPRDLDRAVALVRTAVDA
jgi:hypothetical protein